MKCFFDLFRDLVRICSNVLAGRPSNEKVSPSFSQKLLFAGEESVDDRSSITGCMEAKK